MIKTSDLFESIDILNAVGEVIIHKKITSFKTQIEFRHPGSGIYFLMLRSNDKIICRKDCAAMKNIKS